MDCFLRDAIFTERFFRTDYDIYYYIYFQYIYFQYTTVLCFSIRGGDARVSAPITHLECGGVSGMVSDVLDHHRVEVCFPFGTSKV